MGRNAPCFSKTRSEKGESGVVMPVKAARFLALLFGAVALMMTSAHALELPGNVQYVTLYRRLAIVGGASTVAALVSACALVWLVRRRRPVFEWSVAGALFFVLALASYGPLTMFLFQLLGFSALVVSSELETAARAGARGVVHASASRLIRASPDRVAAIYADIAGWPRVFGRTIAGVRVLDERGPTTTIEVDHVSGRVLNVMSVVAPDEIRLDEWKKRYDARFTNRFERVAGGTRYVIVAEVALKGFLRALAPIARPIVRRQMKRFVLDPIKAVAERGSSAQPVEASSSANDASALS
jgi:hypothetical protein